jgi:hypothetical protein
MTVDLQDSLRKLHSLSNDLNEASDKLGVELNAVEAALNKLKLGVSGWVRIRTEDAGDDYTRVYTLGYYKLKGKWGLVIGEYIEGMEDDSHDGTIFLRDAPRELRVDAAENLADLVAKLAENATKLTKKVTARAVEAKDLAAALSKGRN